MSYIDAMIAQGGGIDLPGIMNKAQVAKQNDLLNLQRQNQIDRAPILNQREDDEYMRTQTIQTAQDFLSVYDTAEKQAPGSGMKSAAQVINALPDTGKFIEMKRSFAEAMATPETTDDQEIIMRARSIAAMAGQGEGFTLAEGASRFNAAGQQVATNPKTATPEKDPEKVRIADATGLTGQRRNDFLLGQGEFGGRTEDGVKVPRPLTAEMAAEFGIPEADRNKYQIGSTGEIELLPTPTSNGAGGELKAYSQMGAENRVKLGLIRNADKLAVQAENKLFGSDGDHHGWSSANPYSEAGIAKKDMREALSSMLRAVSGAAIPEPEIEREVEGMLPTAFDTNKTARAKWDRAKGKIALLHSALTGGFEVPDDLKLSSGGTIQNAADDMKTIGGKTYIKIGNSWFETNNG